MRIDEVAPSKMDVDLVIKDFGKFLQLCMKELDLPKLPKIKWITDGSHHKKFHSFGSFHNDDQVLYIEITDRHPIDIMRTTAHELVHYKQYLDNRIKPNSGETGSEIENEANAVAGIIMRHFDGANPKAFEFKPIDAALMEGEAWQKAAGKNPEGGLNKKGVASYRRSHPGSKLQTAVTTKPSKLKKGSKSAKRRKSFCARMKGMKKHRTGAKTAHDPDSRINKSLRKWHCESIEEMRDMILNAEAYIAEEKQRLDAKCWKGYRKAGTKMKGGIRVNNCVPNESIEEGWKDAAAAAAMVGALGTGAYQGAKHSAPTTNIDGKQFIMYRHTPGNYEKNKMKLTTDDAGNKVYAWVTTSGMKPQYTYRYYIPAKEGVKNENMDHDLDSQAVPELKAALLAQKKKLQTATNDETYDTIDKIMTRIAKSHGISGQKLHDMWVAKYKQIPDTWIMKEAANSAQQAAIAISKKKEKNVSENSYKVSDFRENAFESIAEFKRWMRSPKTDNRGMTRYSVDSYENIFIDENNLSESNNTFSQKKSEAREFSEKFKRLDQRNDVEIKIGNKVSVLSVSIVPGDKHSRIEISGFLTPKKIININTYQDGKIDFIEFADGSRFPETSEFTTIGGTNITNTIFFRDASSASKANTAIWMYATKLEGRGWKIEHHMNENFADGKGPGRPGDSARHGIPKHATMSELEKASHSKGRKGQLARWQMNMRNGKKK